MARTIRQQILRCPTRNRDVEVSYIASGRWFATRYEIVSCPSMFDGPGSCHRQCSPLLSRPSNFMSQALTRI